MTTLHGQGVSRGVAIGPIHRLGSGPAELRPRSGAVPEEELARFEAARAQAGVELEEIYQQTLEALGEENALLFQIHQMVLEDPDFCEGWRSASVTEPTRPMPCRRPLGTRPPPSPPWTTTICRAGPPTCWTSARGSSTS